MKIRKNIYKLNRVSGRNGVGIWCVWDEKVEMRGTEENCYFEAEDSRILRIVGNKFPDLSLIALKKSPCNVHRGSRQP